MADNQAAPVITEQPGAEPVYEPAQYAQPAQPVRETARTGRRSARVEPARGYRSAFRDVVVVVIMLAAQYCSWRAWLMWCAVRSAVGSLFWTEPTASEKVYRDFQRAGEMSAEWTTEKWEALLRNSGVEYLNPRFLQYLLLTGMYLIVLLAIIVVVLWMTARLCMTMAGYLKPLAWRCRGVRFESMRHGSRFSAGKIPDYQVAVLEPGIFGDKHIGYGLRVNEEYLVAPFHVIGDRDVVVLAGKNGKTAIAPSVVKSKLTPDVCYVTVGSQTFSRIGATTLVASSTTGGVGNCAGQEGTSAGLLRKTPVRGALLYEGSTIPGMSGAAYTQTGRVVGMHHGTLSHDGYNFGTAIETIMLEMPFITGKRRLESSEDVHVLYAESSASDADIDDEDVNEPVRQRRGRRAMRAEKRAYWTNADIEEDLTKAWGYGTAEPIPAGMSWVDAMGWESLGRSPVKASRKRKSTVNQTRITIPKTTPITLDVTPQSNDGETEVTYKVVSQPSAELSRVVEDINAAIANLDARITALEKVHASGKGSFPCADCSTVCTSEDKLSKHRLASHPVTYSCTQCPAVCKSVEALARHKETHVEKKYPCGICDVVCRSAERLTNHMQSHVKGESADYDDNAEGPGKPKQAKAFLGKGSSSQRRSPTTSSRSSSSSAGRSRSPSLEVTLSEMAKCLQRLEQSLNVAQRATAGPSSAGTQK
uniref:C2H2-type domain-containing protein n=1 Tax=Soybean thrips sobemo-like virus 4 TaxID=2796568 RepID=A0A7T3UZ41_9VIRU|nr:hypothetical protein [Soybean thrips sobemo-like virus 4]